MKRFFLSILLLSASAIFLNSCNNGAYNADPNGNVSTAPNPIYIPPGGTIEGTCVCKTPMSADVESKEWLAVDSFTSFTTATVNGVTEATIQGKDHSTNSKYDIMILVVNYHGAGTYTLARGGNASAEIIDSTDVLNPYNSNMGSGSGTLIVSSDANGTAEGHFSFTAYTTDGTKSHKVTGGYFKIKH